MLNKVYTKTFSFVKNCLICTLKFQQLNKISTTQKRYDGIRIRIEFKCYQRQVIW